MYCNKPNVNLLTALLPQMGVHDAVVCPGSRNAVIVHNLHALAVQTQAEGTQAFRLHSVTDERSAAFVALGICLANGGAPVAVCVTSGSALLATIPAAAEAFYRHLPIVVISADRPAGWIGQLDGQTLPQRDALLPYARTYTLEEPTNELQEHWCRNTVCQALTACQRDGGRPVHINVPISEPLFCFCVERLPQVSPVEDLTLLGAAAAAERVAAMISAARLPILFIGEHRQREEVVGKIDDGDGLLVLPEIVSNQAGSGRTCALEQREGLPERLRPDLIIHVGGNLVNKRFKLAVRQLPDVRVVRIGTEDDAPDTFCHLSAVVRTEWPTFLHALLPLLTAKAAVREAKKILDEEYRATRTAPTSQQNLLFRTLGKLIPPSGIVSIHVANSTIVRSAAHEFADLTLPLFCNRGVNGIEGSLSAAAGYAAANAGKHLLLIGDLSFFYDVNALALAATAGKLRIILINNGGGNIFSSLPGLDQTPALKPYIAASHHLNAEGACRSFGVRYARVNVADDFAAAASLLGDDADGAALVEVVIDE